MSGHSKWHNIQGKKGKADAARSNIFTKLARGISVAAQQGGADPEMNFSLRLAVDKAKAVNMPKDNIERAIKKGVGDQKDGAVFEEALYEGYGPNNVAFMVEALTDNKNRTVSEVKNVFTKYGGSMASSGAVKWQFNRFGVIRISGSESEKVIRQSAEKKSDFEMELIEAGAEDIIDTEMGTEIKCPVENFQKVLEVIKKYNLETESSGLEWVAKEGVELSESESERVSNLYEALDELDDVKEVYTNEL